MSKKTLSIRLRPSVLAWLEAQATQRELSISATIDQLLFDLMQGPPTARQAPSSTTVPRTTNAAPPAGPAPLTPQEVDLAVRLITKRWIIGVDSQGEPIEQIPSERRALPYKQEVVRTWFEAGAGTAWDHYEGLCEERELQPNDPHMEHEQFGLFSLLMREATAEPKHGAAKPEEKALRQLCRQAWQYHQSLRGDE